MVVGSAADVSSEPFESLVEVVGRARPRRTELQSHVHKGFGSSRNWCLFTEVVKRPVVGTSKKINRGHATVIIFQIHPGRHAWVSTESMGIFDI